MANWAICDYHGTDQGAAAVPRNDTPVNLDLCESVEKISVPRMDIYRISFKFQNNKNVTWNFINSETLNKEHERILKLIVNKKAD